MATVASADAALAAGAPGSDRDAALLRDFETAGGGGDFEVPLRYLRGRILQRAGKPREALEEYREVAARSPELFEPRVRISECLAASEGSTPAEDSLRKVLSESPSGAVPLWERWVVLCLLDLEMEPREVLALLPPEGDGSKTGAPAYSSDLAWLLERLSAGEAVLINCGGKEDYRGSDGRIWSRDRFHVRGRWSRTNFLGHLYRGEILKTEDDPIYRTERWFPAEELPGGYRIPLPKGTYRITLHFAEIEPDDIQKYFPDMEVIEEQARGRARFAFEIEGENAVPEDYTPAQAGFATADTRSFEKTITDGILELTWIPRERDPKISAIEILAVR
jgi:hypothetical protein